MAGMGEIAEIWIKNNLKEMCWITSVCLNRYAEVAISHWETCAYNELVSYQGAKRIDIAVNQYIRALGVFLIAMVCLANAMHNLDCFMDAME